jgi:hypothetical protein
VSYAYYAIISAFVCWKWGNWKAWKEYYPTILYMVTGNLVYMCLTQSKPLWQEGGFLKDYPFLNITSMVLLYSSTIILYLTFYPRITSKPKRAAYVLLWVAIYSAMEYISHITGHFDYDNGWSFFYSVIFSAVMFPLLLLHYKKPLWAWLISIILAYGMMFLFNIPFTKL